MIFDRDEVDAVIYEAVDGTFEWAWRSRHDYPLPSDVTGAVLDALAIYFKDKYPDKE